MANPSSIGVADDEEAIVEVTSTETAIAVDPDRDYTIYHDGFRSDGTTSDLSTVFVSATSGFTANHSSASGKGAVVSGSSRTFGPGKRLLCLKLQAAPPAAPMVTIIPGPHYRGSR